MKKVDVFDLLVAIPTDHEHSQQAMRACSQWCGPFLEGNPFVCDESKYWLVKYRFDTREARELAVKRIRKSAVGLDCQIECELHTSQVWRADTKEKK